MTKEAILTLVGWAVLSALLNLALSERSRIDSWAEKHPKVAGVLKLLRAIGFDPWMLLQSFTLLVHKRLPLAQTEPGTQSKRSIRPPPMMMLALGCACLGLLTGCGLFGSRSPERCSYERPSYVARAAECDRQIGECPRREDGTPRPDCPALIACEEWLANECR